MTVMSRFTCLSLLLALAAQAQDETYPPGTLTPSVDLGLQPVSVLVPPHLASSVPEGLSLNVPEGFSVSLFAAGFRKPRFMAFDAAVCCTWRTRTPARSWPYPIAIATTSPTSAPDWTRPSPTRACRGSCARAVARRPSKRSVRRPTRWPDSTGASATRPGAG